jgi:hypothetical protein
LPELGPLIELLSQAGPTAVLIFMVWLLVSERLVPKGRLDDEKSARREATDGWREQAGATNRTAAALEERNRIDRETLDREHRR